MADTTIASAVVLPEPHDEPSPPSPSLKRRQSSVESPDNKRPRLETGQSNASPTFQSPQSPNQRRRDSALGNRGPSAVEERKRGQRLFGALLGTLSQSSTSAAQRRRADIEKKQQDKLKEKDQELDEERRKKRDKILEKRRKEQIVWERETTKIQQDNALALAHFLKTKTEPHLYYKPWELLPEEEKQIESQIKAATVAVHKERRDVEGSLNKTDTAKVLPTDSEQTVPHDAETVEQPTATEEGPEARREEEQAPEERNEQTKDGEPAPTTNQNEPTKDERASRQEEKSGDQHKGADDHGGEELLEGAEDDVIY